MDVSLKVAGIHWYFRSRSHASELTAGYYNADGRDGYNAIVEMCAAHGAALTLTCVEMCDAQHPPHALCGPEGLLRQVPGPARVSSPVLASAVRTRLCGQAPLLRLLYRTCCQAYCARVTTLLPVPAHA